MGTESGRLRLFISYSRADLAFADELAGGLEIDGAFDIAIDRHSIIEGEDWKKRLGALIADSDTVVFLLSPSSAKSEVCQWEVDEAVRLTKRIVPVLVTALGAQPAPTALAALNALHLDFIAASETAEIARASAAAHALAERERLVAQAEQAAREREAALDQQRAALRASARMQRVASGLMACVIVGLVGWMNQSRIAEEWFKIRHVYPYVLSASQERALQPLGPPFKECTDCPEMIVVPAGEFLMGSPEGQGSYDERPQHKVVIAKPFAVGRYAVTFDEWDRCFALGGCKNPASDSSWGRGRRPVINVNWYDAQGYVAWLSKLTGQPYRLLTEAEWEYAAHADPGSLPLSLR
ncbi:MAG: SUMF1/EgtB/PvdO family nonheme iron enzyme [Hyphomicrobiaceae bacterium]